MSGNKSNRGIGAADKVLDIIEAISSGNRQLADIADQVGLAKSTTYEYLTTLQQRGMVVQQEDGYRIGLKFLDHGAKAKQSYQELLDAAEPGLDRLVESTGEAVNLVVEEQGLGVYIDRRTGKKGVPTDSWTGKHKHLHIISAGKAILAHLPDPRVDSILDQHGLKKITEHTITTPSVLHQQVETIRDQGYAINDQESHSRIRAVGVPIIPNETVIGAISVAGPVGRLDSERLTGDLLQQVQGVVNEIELKMTLS